MIACPFLRCAICYHVHTNPKAETQTNKQKSYKKLRFKCFMHWSSLPSYKYMMYCYLKCSDFQSLLMGFFSIPYRFVAYHNKYSNLQKLWEQNSSFFKCLSKCLPRVNINKSTNLKIMSYQVVMLRPRLLTSYIFQAVSVEFSNVRLFII